MFMTDVTSSYSHSIATELRTSPAHFIKVYTLGNSKVVHKRKFGHDEVIISNKLRPVTAKEIEFVKQELAQNAVNEVELSNNNRKLVELTWDHE